VLALAGLGLALLCRPVVSQAAHEPASSPARRPSQASSATVAEARPSDALYRRRCSRCHEDDGTGGQQRGTLPGIPDFSNHRWQASHSDAGLLVSILEGKGTQMPAFNGKITEPDARGLVAHIRTFDPTPAIKRTAGTAAGMSADSPDDFEERFRRLDEELQELKRKYHELADPPKKP
jgi:mono/diheme cytochrome c family protein